MGGRLDTQQVNGGARFLIAVPVREKERRIRGSETLFGLGIRLMDGAGRAAGSWTGPNGTPAPGRPANRPALSVRTGPLRECVIVSEPISRNQ